MNILRRETGEALATAQGPAGTDRVGDIKAISRRPERSVSVGRGAARGRGTHRLDV